MPITEGNQSFLGKSGGYQADTSLGQLFQGAGNLLKDTVNLVDDTIKEDIKTDIKETATKTLFDSNQDAGVPSEITNTTARMEKLNKAKATGGLTDTQFWSTLDVESRKLRSRYPGHRDFIDDAFSSITGGSPANKLRAALQAEQKSLRSQADKQEAQRVRLLNTAASQGLIAEGEDQNISSIDLRNRISQRANTVNTLQMIRDREAADKSQGEGRKRRATDSYNRSLAIVHRDMLTGGPLKTLVDSLKNTSSEQPLNAEQRLQKSQQLALVRQTFVNAAEKEADRLLGESGQSYRGLIDPKKLRETISGYTGWIDQIETDLNSKESGALTWAKRNVVALEEDTNLNMMMNNPSLAVTKNYRAAMGDTAFSAMLSREELISHRQSYNRDVEAQNLAVGGTPTVVRALQNMKQSNGDDSSKANLSLINNVIQHVESDKVPNKIKANSANSLFNLMDGNLVDLVGHDNRNSVYSRIISPKMIESMEKIKQTNPNVYRRYLQWSSDSFARIQMGNINELIKMSKDGRKISFRVNKTGHVEYNEKEPTVNFDSPIDAVSNFFSSSTSDIQRTIESFNDAIDTFRPVLGAKNDNKATESMVRFLQSLGFNVNSQFGTIDKILSAVDAGIAHGRLRRMNVEQERDNIQGAEETNELGGGEGNDNLFINRGVSPDNSQARAEIMSDEELQASEERVSKYQEALEIQKGVAEQITDLIQELEDKKLFEDPNSKEYKSWRKTYTNLNRQNSKAFDTMVKLRDKL